MVIICVQFFLGFIGSIQLCYDSDLSNIFYFLQNYKENKNLEVLHSCITKDIDF